MALINCKQCKAEISSNADKCPSCGEPVNKPMSRWKILLVGIFGLFIFKTCSTYNSIDTAKSSNTTTTTTTTIAAAQPVVSAPTLKEWEYFNQSDSMTGKSNQFATLTSDNSLNLSFPYKGKNYGMLTIRQAKGTDVIFSIEQGQMLCNSYSGCSITVRFDDNPPQKFNASEPADHSKTYLFVNDTARFINAAKKAKAIKVQPLLFQQGAQVLEFSTPKPLEWPRK